MSFWTFLNDPVYFWLVGHYRLLLSMCLYREHTWICASVYSLCTSHNIILLIKFLIRSDQRLRVQHRTRHGIIPFNDSKVVRSCRTSIHTKASKAKSVSSCLAKALSGSCVWGFIIHWEWGTGEWVLISALSHWEPGRLQSNPEKRNTFITEQQTRKQLGAATFPLSTDGRHSQARLCNVSSAAAVRWCEHQNGCINMHTHTHILHTLLHKGNLLFSSRHKYTCWQS